MKKVTAILVALSLLLCMTGCVSQSDLNAVIEERDMLRSELAALQNERDEMYAVLSEYEMLIALLREEHYEEAMMYIQNRIPQPEYDEIQITKDNWSDYFEISIKETFERDTFGNPLFYRNHGYISLKEEYRGRVVPNKHMDIHFNTRYTVACIEVKADFTTQTAEIVYRDSPEETIEDVMIFERGNEGFCGRFGKYGGSGSHGTNTIYYTNDITDFEIIDVYGILYLTK